MAKGRLAIMVAVAIGAGVIGGCSGSVAGGGSSRVMPTGDYDAALTAGRRVLSQYFSIAEVDKSAGTIRSMPKTISADGAPLAGSAPTRQIATVRMRRIDGRIVAHVWVELQRPGSPVHRIMRQRVNNYDSIANETPAQLEAATSPRQNEIWQTSRYLRNIQQRILEDLWESLSPPAERDK